METLKACRGDEDWGGGVRIHPVPSRLEGLGERRELSQPSLGRSPGRERLFSTF